MLRKLGHCQLLHQLIFVHLVGNKTFEIGSPPDCTECNRSNSFLDSVHSLFDFVRWKRNQFVAISLSSPSEFRLLSATSLDFSCLFRSVTLFINSRWSQYNVHSLSPIHFLFNKEIPRLYTFLTQFFLLHPQRNTWVMKSRKILN